MIERLTKQLENGDVTLVKDMSSENIQEALCVLADYEQTGLIPAEIVEFNTFVGSQVEKLLTENRRLKFERDKAVEDMEDIVDGEDYCKSCCIGIEHCNNRTTFKCGNFKWQGFQEEI